MRKCPHYARNRLEFRKNATKLQLFPSSSPLTSVCIAILGPFIKKQQRNAYTQVITDRLRKMTKMIPMKVIPKSKGGEHFMNAWVFNYGPPYGFIVDNIGLFTRKVCIDVWKFMPIKEFHHEVPPTKHWPCSTIQPYHRCSSANLRCWLSLWLWLVQKCANVRVKMPTTHIKNCGYIRAHAL